MKGFLLLIASLFIFSANAEFDVAFRPERAVVDEIFEMDITIQVQNNDEPFISFDPGGLVVEGRRNAGVSFTTQLINGQFTSQKTMRVTYQLRANRAGTFYLRDFTITMGQQKISKDNVRVIVLREAEKPKDYLLEALPSKERVYKGEGFFVDYYLYTRVPIYAQELKEYPKLNGFLKRFKNVDESPERVERGGIIYQRSKKYSAKLFPEKIGQLTIDALKLQLGVGFGANSTGFGMRDIRNVTAMSAPVTIEVSEVPSENLPTTFTGLIGDHNFNLIVSKTKYLANEPIELKLEVIGPGMLEKMDDPVFYSHPDLETFDTKSEVQEISNDRSRKIIEYTYLPRASLQIAARKLELAVYLPEKNQFKTISLDIPEIEVVGGGANPATRPRTPLEPVSEPVVAEIIAKKELAPISPFDLTQKRSDYINPIRLLLIIALGLFVIALISNMNFRRNDHQDELWDFYRKHLSKGISYKGLLLFLSRAIPDSSLDVEEALMQKNIPTEVRDYLLDLLRTLRQTTYSPAAAPRVIKPKKQMFKRLLTNLK